MSTMVSIVLLVRFMEYRGLGGNGGVRGRAGDWGAAAGRGFEQFFSDRIFRREDAPMARPVGVRPRGGGGTIIIRQL